MTDIRTRVSSRISRAAWTATAVALGCGLLVTTAAVPTQAAFEGSNGLIAYASDNKPDVAPVNDDINVLRPIGTTADGTVTYESVRLSVNPAPDRQPAMSPNGKEIAFVRGSGTAREIYVMDTHDDDGDGEGDNLRQVTSNALADVGPAWSPDGRKPSSSGCCPRATGRSSGLTPRRAPRRSHSPTTPRRIPSRCSPLTASRSPSPACALATLRCS